jgi:anthranilate phosphoribosyltransferase
MKNVAPVRKDLGVKTFFNMLGPMVNPTFPKNQMVGVYSLELARIYNYLYQQTDKNFVILHSLDGYDEISLTSEFKLISRDYEVIMKPGTLGLIKTKPEELASGASVPESTELFMKILEGKGTKAQTDVVIANSAVALRCMKSDKSFEDCIAEARESLLGGKALKALRKLIEMQN